MIITSPRYVNGDNLKLKKYFKCVLDNNTVVFSSVAVWLRKIMIFYGLPLLGACLFMALLILPQVLLSSRETNWILIIAICILPSIFMVPYILIVTYCKSFIVPRIASKNTESFISKYIPDAIDIKRITPTNYILKRNNVEYEIAYSNSAGNNRRVRKIFIITVYYFPKSENISKIFDENGNLSDEFTENWYSYCNSKDNCKLCIDNENIFAIYFKNELPMEKDVVDTMDNITYLMERFGLFPLQRETDFSGIIFSWLKELDKPVPKDITDINFNIYENNTGYTISISCSKSYNHNDGAAPLNHRLDIPISDNNIGLKQFQSLVETCITLYIKNTTDHSSLFYGKNISIEVNGKNLKKFNNLQSIMFSS